MIPVRAFLFLTLVLFAGPGLVQAQAQALTLRVEKDGAALPGAEVRLHRVTQDTAGAIATGATDAAGSHRFELPPPRAEGFTVYFVTAEHQGVRYFGPPVHPGEVPARYAIEVFDTAWVESGSPAIRLGRRDVIVVPGTNGTAEVDEILRIENTSRRTLTAAPGGHALSLPLPAGVAAFQVGEGMIAPEVVQRVGDRIFLTGSLTPGAHELFVRYRLDPRARSLPLPVAPGTDSVNVFVRLPDGGLRVADLGTPATVQVENETFLRFSGGSLGERGAVQLQWGGAAVPPMDPRHAAAGVTALILLAGAAFAVRARPRTDA